MGGNRVDKATTTGRFERRRLKEMNRIPTADTNESFISQVLSGYSKLRRTEQRVADIVTQDLGRAIDASSLDLAVLANVSESTVLRFCRAVGCNSLKELQSRLRES